jgi:hypothetical protein
MRPLGATYMIAVQMNYGTSWARRLIIGSLLICSSCQANNHDKDRHPPTPEEAKNPSALRRQVESKPKWSAVCSLPEAVLTVEFNSPSRDVTEDDMTATVRWSDGSSAPIPAKPGWFTEAANVTSEAENVCTTIVGTALPDKRLLLWFLRNDRPNGDQLQLALLSVADKHVLDTKADIGEIASDPTIIKRGSGFSALLFKEWRQNGPGGGEFGVAEWKDIRVENDHIIAVWRDRASNSKAAQPAARGSRLLLRLRHDPLPLPTAADARR